MSFNANVLQVLIASPGDTIEERNAVERALHGWNASRAEREQVVLLPRRWETDAVPVMGSSGQETINAQLVDKCDIVIALFDARLGQATKNAVSGTAEEIERAAASGKPVHVWFSDAPVSRDHLEGAQVVAEFRQTLEAEGLLGSYASAEDLAYQVRNAVEADLERLELAAPTGRILSQGGAEPVASYHYRTEQVPDSKGKLRTRQRGHRIIVTNKGDAPAEDFTLTLEPMDDLEVPHMLSSEASAAVCLSETG
ncbi:DUF4062 domain-containing protein [Enteractinococcus helveticum]|nr:DUF4062 domain-containing protein [Enteractinococcus helveticum]